MQASLAPVDSYVSPPPILLHKAYVTIRQMSNCERLRTDVRFGVISIYKAYVAIYHRTAVVLALFDFINADVLSSDRDLIGELAYPCYEGECAHRAPIRPTSRTYMW